MKIISKYKDYYDYLIGIYGEDPLIVLDRREGSWPSAENEIKDRLFELHIGGYMAQGFVPGYETRPDIPQKFYWGKALRELDEYEKLEPNWSKARSANRNSMKKYIHNKERVNAWMKYTGTNRESCTFIDLQNDEKLCFFTHSLVKAKVDLNLKHDCPILLIDREFPELRIWKMPCLESIGIGSLLEPHDAFVLISSWLSDKRTRAELRPENMTNDQKIASKGFDIKTSFRPLMK